MKHLHKQAGFMQGGDTVGEDIAREPDRSVRCLGSQERASEARLGFVLAQLLPPLEPSKPFSETSLAPSSLPLTGGCVKGL